MARLFAYLSFRDAPAGIAWMEALGFEVTTRQDAEDGGIAHAELRLGEVVLMVASADADYETPALVGNSTGGGLYLLVDDVAVIHEAALGGGASEVFPPEQTEWGTSRSRVLDPEGHEWSFGTYEPGATW